MRSDRVIPKGRIFLFSSLRQATITVSAVLKDYIDGSISDGSNHKCTLKLYKGGILANSFDFYADGETYTFDVVGLDVTKNYSISVHNTSYTSNQRLRVTGEGHITNYSAN